MSDYSFSLPCVHINLSSAKVDELREFCGAGDVADDYIVQLRSHLSSGKPVPFGLLKTFWKNNKGKNVLRHVESSEV